MKSVFWILLCFFSLSHAQSLHKETILKEEKGFIMCTGGTQAVLFSKDCDKITLSRVWAGSIVYEGACLDSNGITYSLSCQSYNFEYNQKVEKKDSKSYWEKSNDKP